MAVSEAPKHPAVDLERNSVITRYRVTEDWEHRMGEHPRHRFDLEVSVAVINQKLTDALNNNRWILFKGKRWKVTGIGKGKVEGSFVFNFVHFPKPPAGDPYP